MTTDPLEFTDAEKKLIKDALLQRVRAGSDIAIVFAGKTVLGLTEKQKIEVQTIPFQDKTYEELLEMIAERREQEAENRLLTQLEASTLTPPKDEE